LAAANNGLAEIKSSNAYLKMPQNKSYLSNDKAQTAT
jgi:hypothetical protein